MRQLILIALLAFTGCDDQPASATASSEARRGEAAPELSPFLAAWAPPAPGSGNFEICMTDLVNGMPDNARVRFPAGVLLQSWGPLTGDMMDPSTSADPGIVDGHDAAAVAAKGYAVITTGPVTLSMAHPCEKVSARAAISVSSGYLEAEAPFRLHYSFQALSRLRDGAWVPVADMDLKAWADRAIIAGTVVGTPVADIGDPFVVKDPPDYVP